jgi:hypothetical protein
LSPFMPGLLRAYVHDHHRQYGFIGHLRHRGQCTRPKCG